MLYHYAYESLRFLHDKFLRNYLVEKLEDTISTFRNIVCDLPYLKLKRYLFHILSKLTTPQFGSSKY